MFQPLIIPGFELANAIQLIQAVIGVAGGSAQRRATASSTTAAVVLFPKTFSSWIP
jgi:hypothetical protein